MADRTEAGCVTPDTADILNATTKSLWPKSNPRPKQPVTSFTRWGSNLPGTRQWVLIFDAKIKRLAAVFCRYRDGLE